MLQAGMLITILVVLITTTAITLLQEAANWPSAAVQIAGVISTLILAYLTWRNGQVAREAKNEAVKAASYVETEGREQTAKLNELKEVAEIGLPLLTTVKINTDGVKTELERQNAALRRIVEKGGLNVPDDLKSKNE